jgi:hypothetical protein
MLSMTSGCETADSTTRARDRNALHWVCLLGSFENSSVSAIGSRGIELFRRSNVAMIACRS